MASASTASAQLHQPAAQTAGHVWADIDFATITSMQGSEIYSRTYLVYSQEAVEEVKYQRLANASHASLQAGIHVTRELGVAGRYTRANYDQTILFRLARPSPIPLGVYGGVVGHTTDPFPRRDVAVDLSAVYFLPSYRGLSIRLYGGPTFFATKQRMVLRIGSTQLARTPTENVITITGTTPVDARATGIGGHAGVDIAYFVTKFIGAGAFISVSDGKIEIQDEPFSNEIAVISPGKVLVGVGARVRF